MGFQMQTQLAIHSYASATHQDHEEGCKYEVAIDRQSVGEAQLRARAEGDHNDDSEHHQHLQSNTANEYDTRLVLVPIFEYRV